MVDIPSLLRALLDDLAYYDGATDCLFVLALHGIKSCETRITLHGPSVGCHVIGATLNDWWDKKTVKPSLAEVHRHLRAAIESKLEAFLRDRQEMGS